MNKNEMKNATIADIDEVNTPVAATEDAAAPIQEPAAQDETNTAEAENLAPEAVPAPADDGVDEEDEDVPAAQELSRNARRFNDDDLEIGDFIDDGNDMLKVDMPEDRRARDLAEMRRCVFDNKRTPRRFLQGRVFGVRPVGSGSAVVEVTRGTLRIMIQAEDFFHFSQMKGIENDDDATRQRRYLRKAKLMNGAIINFCPYMEAESEDGEVVFAGSRQDAMQIQRNRHFFGRNADVKNGSRAAASILSTGPDYVIAEALGVETSIGAAALSAYEYIDNVAEKYHVGDGIPVVVEDLHVDAENGTVSLRLNRAILERRANPAMNIHRPTNVDLKAKYIVFDFNGMKGPTLTMSMFVVLDFVWTKIKEDRAKRKAVFIDECWKLIGTDSNEMAAEDVVEIFRTIRAYGGSAFAMTQDISQFYEYKGGKYGKAVIGNADTKIIMHLIPSEAKALQAAIQLTDSEMENVSNLGRGQGLVCSGAAKLFVDFIAAPYEKQEITTDAKSFYLQEKALKEKQHKEEQERLAAEKTNSNSDANDDDADLLNVTF